MERYSYDSLNASLQIAITNIFAVTVLAFALRSYSIANSQCSVQLMIVRVKLTTISYKVSMQG